MDMSTIRVVIAFLLVVAVKCGTEDTEAMCKSTGCKYPRTSLQIPGNERELNKFCSMEIEYYNCLMDYANRCRAEDMPQFRSAIDILHTICDEDSELYKTLVLHIGCIKESMTNYNISCKKLVEQIQISAGSQNIDKEKDERYDCLYRAMEVSCLAMKIGESCDVAGEKVFSDVVNELRKGDDFCGGPMLKNIAKLSQKIDMGDELRERLLSFLD